MLSSIRPSALTIRQKLVFLALGIVVVVSFGFTVLQLSLSRRWVEEDLRERAVSFAREVAATIGDQRELESGVLLRRQIQLILDARQNVHQLDILAFAPGGARVVATSHPGSRLPFSRRDADQVRRGRVLSRLVTRDQTRYWEVMAPIVIEDAIAGAVAARFSLERADALAARIRRWAFVLTAASVVVMGLLMGLAVQVVVNRPLTRFMEAIRRVRAGDPAAPVHVASHDEFGVLAGHFNAMMARLAAFSEELKARVAEATRELEERYRELARLNEQLFALQRRLSQAERLALSGRIMAEVAHEVGTPLHSVAGHLELLRKDIDRNAGPEALVRRLGIIDTQLARTTEIIARLLDLPRRPRPEPDLVDLGRLIEETVDLVRPGLPAARVELRVASEPQLPPVRGDRTQLQQVVLNLLTNALDATDPGGRVEVAARALESTREVEIEVADTGRGIPQAIQKEIFEPFFTTKPPGRGTGLGLSISAQIVREHGGRIEVASEVGRGTSFRVILPIPAGRA